jgi:signal transduction histidine kinase/CheY-like chemotaxis protein/HPt (histidine-containing phosphotransfer) domain-containing protein
MAKQHHFSFIRAAVCVFLFFLALNITIYVTIYRSTSRNMLGQMGKQCLGVASAVAVIIEEDIEGYRAFTKSLDTHSFYYRTIKQKIEKIRQSNEDNISFLYTEMKISDTEIMFILDGESQDAEQFSPPGTIEPLTSLGAKAYASQAAHIDEGFSETSYGTLLSAYAPIRDASGEFLGFVGADISRAQYDEIMRGQLYIIVASVFVFSLMVLILSVMLLRLYRQKVRSDQESLSKSSFLARMSHEIRTPMNAIMGMSELMLRENLPASAREQAVSVRQASTNLLAIINDILDFSKVESGKMEFVDAPYQLSSLINNTISIIRMRLMDKPVLFAVNVASNLPNDLIGDEVRLRQILLNVLSNAVKYTREGSVSLSITGQSVDANKVTLIIQVTDTGIGIKEENLSKVFGDFIQVDLQSHKTVEGTGLGLAIAKRLCQSMGGDISVASKYGEGSTFTITLPQQWGEYSSFAEVESPEEKAVLLYEGRQVYADSICHTIKDLGVRCKAVSSHSFLFQELQEHAYTHVFVSSLLYSSVKHILARLHLQVMVVVLEEFGERTTEVGIRPLALPAYAIPVADALNGVKNSAGYGVSEGADIRFIAPTARVLVVDDINTNLSVTAGLLAPYKMTVDCAISGKEAIRLIRVNHYDLVLMDHMMPEMDGIEATARIRALGGNSGENPYTKLPIIALTASAVSGMRDMFLKNGFDDFIAKPIETNKLYTVMDKWIPKEKQEQRAESDQSPAVAPVIEIAGLDTHRGIAMTGGDIDNYRHILDVFYSDCAEKTRQIRDYLEAGQIPLFTTNVHALKSAFGSIGATVLAEYAARLEHAGSQEDMGYLWENTEPFLFDLAELSESIAEFLERTMDSDSDGAQKSDNSELITQLIVLKEALAAIDVPGTDDALEKLREGRWLGDVRQRLELISQAILLFKYEEAIQEIDSLLSELEVAA